MSTGQAAALDVLREVWRSQGQLAQGLAAADLDDSCGEKHCRKMDDAGVGFDGFADDGDLAGAWRAKLAREGKLRPGGTVGDLVLGSAER